MVNNDASAAAVANGGSSSRSRVLVSRIRLPRRSIYGGLAPFPLLERQFQILSSGYMAYIMITYLSAVFRAAMWFTIPYPSPPTLPPALSFIL